MFVYFTRLMRPMFDSVMSLMASVPTAVAGTDCEPLGLGRAADLIISR